MDDVRPAVRHDQLATLCAILGLVLIVPLVAIQLAVLGGSVLSANGLDRFVPALTDVDYDGTREIVVGCPNDGCAVCDWHGAGWLRVGTVVSDACSHW